MLRIRPLALGVICDGWQQGFRGALLPEYTVLSSHLPPHDRSVSSVVSEQLPEDRNASRLTSSLIIVFQNVKSLYPGLPLLLCTLVPVELYIRDETTTL